nr:hypothetical protein [Pirellula staleyi]
MDVTYGPELRFVPPSRRSFLNLLPTGGLATKLMGWLMPYVPKFVINAFIRRLLVTWQHPENALFDDGAILVNQLGRRFCDERDITATCLRVSPSGQSSARAKTFRP